MTNSTSRPEDLFEFQVLTKILGPLNYRVLKILKDELKSNAACVDSNLGGATNGHLGLILTPLQYASVSTTPYVRLTMPAVPVIPSNMAQHAAIRERDDYKEDKRLFKEMVAVEKALLKQMSRALPVIYLKTFRNKHSNAIDKPVSEILAYLFTTYGRVSQQTLSEEQVKLREKVFDISEPLIMMYNEVEDLQDLATAAVNPFSDTQIVTLGIDLIKNTGDFEKGLTEWYEKDTNQEWRHFKPHFELAQDNLRKVRGPTMKSGALMQQANAISQQVMLNMEHERAEYLNAVRATESRIVEAIRTPPMIEEQEVDHEKMEPSVNSSIASDPIMVEVLKLLKELKSENNTNDSDNNNNTKRYNNNNKRYNNNNNNRNTRNQRQRKNNNNNNNKENQSNGDRNGNRFPALGMKGADGNYIRFNTSKYCWSHGACNHDGQNCKKPKAGHNKTATFSNLMGGNTDFCQRT